jgi:hypothetical protein
MRTFKNTGKSVKYFSLYWCWLVTLLLDGGNSSQDIAEFLYLVMISYTVGTKPTAQMARMHLPVTGGEWPVSYGIGSGGGTLFLA